MSYVISLHDITLHKVSQQDEMEEFFIALQELEKEFTQPVANIKCGEMYIAKDLNTKKWCRAMLFNYTLTDEIIILRNVDLGVFVPTNRHQIFTPPIEFQAKPPYGIRCSLACTNNKDKEFFAIYYLMKLLGKQFTLKIVMTSQVSNVIELYDEQNRNVVDEMVKLKFVTRLIIPFHGTACISHVENLLVFYLQFGSQAAAIGDMKLYTSHYIHIPLRCNYFKYD